MLTQFMKKDTEISETLDSIHKAKGWMPFLVKAAKFLNYFTSSSKSDRMALKEMGIQDSDLFLFQNWNSPNEFKVGCGAVRFLFFRVKKENEKKPSCVLGVCCVEIKTFPTFPAVHILLETFSFACEVL